MKARFRWFISSLLAAAGLLLFLTSVAGLYRSTDEPWCDIVTQSTNAMLMRVEAVDKEKNLIIFNKVRDLKGKHPRDVIKHNIGRNGLRANEWKKAMDWAEPGKMAVFFHNQQASETCLGNWWYQCYSQGEWWCHTHGEPYLLRSLCWTGGEIG